MLLRYVLTLLDDIFVDSAAKVSPMFTKKSLNDSEISLSSETILGFRTSRVLFVSFWLIFSLAVRVMSVTKDEVPDQIKVNNDQLIAPFKELLRNTAGQIKRANDTSVELPMKETKELKFREPLKFKKKASEHQYKFNLKLKGHLRQHQDKSAAEKTNLEKVKSDLEECEKLLVERQKCILPADKSKYGCGKTEYWHARCPAMTE